LRETQKGTITVTAGERRPHLLYIAWGFPPSRGGGVYRALATANAFAERGWDVTVLTAEREVFLNYTGADTSLEPLINPDVRIVRIPFSWPTLEADVRKFGWLRVYAPRTWGRLRPKLDSIPFPERGYGPWRRPLEQAAERIHAERPVDLVVASANPHVDFMAAWRLHQRGVPYVMDYRDAWLLDVFSGERLHGARSRPARWERRLVAQAREVWFVNRPIRDWHARLYPEHAERFHVVANGYDPDLAPVVSERVPDGELTFGYVGTISAKVPIGELIAGWRLARERSELIRKSQVHLRGYLGFYQTARADLRALVTDAAGEGVTYLGPVPKTDVKQAYADFDVLLLILGTGRYVTSGKVYEYMASGLPIVSVHDPSNAASDELRDYPLWFPVSSLEPEEIAAAVIRGAEAAVTSGSRLRAASVEVAARFRRDLQLRPRIEELKRGVTGEPVTEEPVTEEPVTDEPVTDEPVTDEPA
jgi:glycosyltransferase involved in cell wall biosynthesis